ncbi:MAG: hypothetical protein QY331_14445 [Melioribacteraceae bacterium]|nr:MAG: hypothetical protein QY331_14445 [Melioribacteraceae bacterium]
MVSTKEVSLTVRKPYNYFPIPEHEKKRVSKFLSKTLLEVANRFDGPSKITVTIQAKGNA